MYYITIYTRTETAAFGSLIMFTRRRGPERASSIRGNLGPSLAATGFAVRLPEFQKDRVPERVSYDVRSLDC